jgi:diguanylate cyclase (GGDEF)-like protein
MSEHHYLHPYHIAKFIARSSPLQRTAFLLFLIILVNLQYFSWALTMYSWSFAHQYLDPMIIGKFIPIGFLFLVINITLYVVCRYLSNHPSYNLQTNIQTFCAVFYSVNTLFYGHLIGSMSMASGAIMLGSPIFGLFLLEMRSILISLGFGIIAIIGLCLGSVFGLLAYAPVVIYTENINTTPFWFLSLMYFILPYWIVVCGLCFFIIQNLRQREHEVRYLAEHDALTGLYNRHYINKKIQRLCLHQNPQLMSIILLDLDQFKLINDQYGHLCGDQVLQLTSLTLKTHCPQAMIGRFGGEEFIIILPEYDLQHAYQCAEMLRHQLSSLLFHYQKYKVSIQGSFGVACRNITQIDEFQQLIQQADHALYQAKRQGRNQVVVAHNNIDTTHSQIMDA